MIKKEKSVIYFGEEAEKNIRDYVNSDDYYFRQQLYTEKIAPVFSKLIENIIFRYDFIKLGDNYESLQHEIMSFLYLSLDRFNPILGFRAFSYFGTCVKRYCQQKSINKAFENKNIDDIYDREKGEINDEMLKNAIVLQDQNQINENKEFISVLIKHFEKKKLKDEKEEKVLEAIIYLLKNYEGINLSNKKHVYVLLKGYTNLDTKTITKIMTNFVKDYIAIKKKYINCEI